MDDLRRIVRYALRKLTKNQGSSLVAVLAMALGIGLTASMVAIIDGVYLRGLPFEDSERLMHLERAIPSQDIDSMEVAQHDFEVWVDQQTQFEGIGACTSGTMNIADDGPPGRFDGSWISHNFLDILGVEPLHGRGFRASDAEPGAPKVILLSHDVWQKRYGSDPGVVDRPVRINTEPGTIIGVMEPGFRFPVREEVWMPLILETGTHDRSSNELPTLEVFGKLREGLTIDSAVGQMNLIENQLTEQYPDTNEGMQAVIKPYIEEFISEEQRRMLGVMFAAVILVLLIACFNVANLLIGRATMRGRETAIRSALGSGRWQSIVEMLAESSLLAFSGAVVGVALAHLGVRAFEAALMTTSPPFWMYFTIDGRVLAAVGIFTVLAALVSGLIPALQAARPDIRQILTDTTRGSTSYRLGGISRVMVVAQVAFSCALLITAGLAVRSIVEANTFEHNFDRSNVLTARVGLFEGDYPEDSDRVAFFDNAQRMLASNAQVQKAAVGTVIPAEQRIGSGRSPFERPGETYDHDFQRPRARYTVVSPGYFEVLGTEVLTGRDFLASDNADAAKVAIVNQSFASQEWPDQNPVGQRIDFRLSEEEEAADPQAGWVEVVGVVQDLRFAEFDNADDQQGVYVPLAQNPVRFAWLIARTHGDPMSFSEPMRRTILELDPNLPLYFMDSMENVLSQTMFFQNLIGTIFGIFGAVAVFLACVGLYGLMAFAVTRRTQEMGVRMALGAERQDVLKLVLRQGMKQTAVGLAFGVAMGAGLSLLMSSVLFNVRTGDPTTFLGVPLILLAVAVMSCLIPARRASTVDPMVALRHD